jgi:general L-amino acid transport system substrate-binding protein
MRFLRHAGAIALASGLGLASSAGIAEDRTFERVRSRGFVVCGTATGLPGFGSLDGQGNWRGLYVDTCRALAAAMYGDASKVRFVPTTTQNRLPMLQSGEIDILASNTTWTLTREASLGLIFTGTTFFDGQGFLVKSALGVKSVKDLDGATICVQPGTTTELNLTDYFRANRLRFTPVVIDNSEEIQGAFIADRCDAYTLGTAALGAFRASQGAQASNYVLLPEIISKEPLGPVIRKGDWRWFDLVRWTQFAMLNAEELGISSANIDHHRDDANPEIQRFLGKTGDFGRMLGLENDWAVKIVKQVGNFAESWARNVGPLDIPRGINQLWTQGGIQYPMPMR